MLHTVWIIPKRCFWISFSWSSSNWLIVIWWFRLSCDADVRFLADSAVNSDSWVSTTLFVRDISTIFSFISSPALKSKVRSRGLIFESIYFSARRRSLCSLSYFCFKIWLAAVTSSMTTACLVDPVLYSTIWFSKFIIDLFCVSPFDLKLANSTSIRPSFVMSSSIFLNWSTIVSS